MTPTRELRKKPCIGYGMRKQHDFFNSTWAEDAPSLTEVKRYFFATIKEKTNDKNYR